MSKYVLIILCFCMSGCMVIKTKSSYRRALDVEYQRASKDSVQKHLEVYRVQKHKENLKFMGINSLIESYRKKEDIIQMKIYQLDMNIHNSHRQQVEKEVEQLEIEQDDIMEEIRLREMYKEQRRKK